MQQIDHFSNRLKTIRNQKRLSLEEFSKAVDIPAQTLNRYELNQRTPKIDVTAKIAEKLSINPLWLYGYDVPMEYPEPVALPFPLSQHELRVITEYHNQTEMQPAVDRLLGIGPESEMDTLHPIHLAAHHGDGIERRTCTSAQLKKAKELRKKIQFKGK